MKSAICKEFFLTIKKNCRKFSFENGDLTFAKLLKTPVCKYFFA